MFIPYQLSVSHKKNHDLHHITFKPHSNEVKQESSEIQTTNITSCFWPPDVLMELRVTETSSDEPSSEQSQSFPETFIPHHYIHHYEPEQSIRCLHPQTKTFLSNKHVELQHDDFTLMFNTSSTNKHLIHSNGGKSDWIGCCTWWHWASSSCFHHLPAAPLPRLLFW